MLLSTKTKRASSVWSDKQAYLREEVDCKNLKIMNITYFFPKRRGNVVNENNSPVNIRFVVKTSYIRNFSESIRSDVKTSEVATVDCSLTDRQCWITSNLTQGCQINFFTKGQTLSKKKAKNGQQNCWKKPTTQFALWELVYEYIVPGFWPKTRSFRLCNNSQRCCSSTPARASKPPQECRAWCQLFAKWLEVSAIPERPVERYSKVQYLDSEQKGRVLLLRLAFDSRLASLLLRWKNADTVFIVLRFSFQV